MSFLFNASFFCSSLGAWRGSPRVSSTGIRPASFVASRMVAMVFSPVSGAGLRFSYTFDDDEPLVFFLRFDLSGFFENNSSVVAFSFQVAIYHRSFGPPQTSMSFFLKIHLMLQRDQTP